MTAISPILFRPHNGLAVQLRATAPPWLARSAKVRCQTLSPVDWNALWLHHRAGEPAGTRLGCEWIGLNGQAERALRDKKHRKRERRFLAEGLRLLTDARESGHLPGTLVMATGRDPHPLLDALERDVLAAGGEVIGVIPEQAKAWFAAHPLRLTA